MNAPTQKAISVENLGKKYRLYERNIDRLKEAISPFQKSYHTDFSALRDVSFSIAKGESIGIVGKNGSGKSTLLKLLTGVVVPTSGTLRIEGKIAALLELGAGFNPELTGIENIYFNGALMGYSRKDMAEKVGDIVEFADIGEFIHQPVRLYSSGMFARLAFAVAINVDPDILIVDEALSVGDFAFQMKCFQRIRSLKEARGLTLIFVSHDVNAVKSLCTRCLWLQNGVLKIDGPAGDVCDDYIQSQMEESGLFFDSDKPTLESGATQPISRALTADQTAEFEKRVRGQRRGDQRVAVAYAEVAGATGAKKGFVFGETLTLNVYVKSSIDLPSAVLAFYVKDKNQIEVIGTNSDYEDKKLVGLQSGHVYKYSVSFSNRLPAGDYSVSAILADKVDDSNYFDWVDGLVTFTSIVDPRKPRWCQWTPDFSVELADVSET